MKALLPILFLAIGSPLLAQTTTWTDGGADSSWSDSANWSNGAPVTTSTSSIVTIGAQPAGDTIGIDTGVADTGVGSLALSGSLNATVQFVAAGIEQLTVFTNITNASAQLIKFALPVAADDQEASLLNYSTGGGLEFDGGLSVGLSPIAVSGAGGITLGNGAYTTIAIQDSGTYGAFQGAGTVNYNNTNLQFDFTNASQSVGTTWQLFAANTGNVASVSFVGDNLDGSLSEVTTGLWSGYVGGIFWTFNQSTGVLGAASAPSLTITTGSPLANGTNDVTYSQTFSASYGSSPYHWSITSGTLPAGLMLSSQGLLSGTPSGSGTFGFTVQVEDQTNATQSMTYALTIVLPLAITSTTPLPGGIVGDAYSQTLTGAGGTPTYTWSVASGSLPAGLALASTGLLSGTPSASGSFNFVAQVADMGGSVVTGTYSVDIVGQLAIATGGTLSTGTAGHTYSATLSSSGGESPYAWSLIGGSLPGNLVLSTAGMLSGTLDATGTFGFTAEVMDGSGQSQSKAFTLAVVEPLSVASATLASGTISTAYSQSLAAGGGSPPYHWSLASGAPPGGTSVSGSGTLAGAPSTTGTFTFVAKVTDNSGATATGAFTVVIVEPLAITTASPITSGSVSYNYSQIFTATGGVIPYSWSVTGGSPPPGLDLSPGGALSGIPSDSGTYTFTAQVEDGSGTTLAKDFTVAIAATLMPKGTVGTFIGLIDRQGTVNGGLGGRLDLTTTATGKVTGKITQEGHVRSFKTTVLPNGGGEPQINVTVANGTAPSLQLSLLLDGAAGQLSGTVLTNGTTAAVTGWRRVWNKKTNPATALAGYYSFVLELSDTNDQASASIPQGNGYGAFTVGLDGSLRIVGKTADGQTFSTAGFVGPDGEIPVYQSLYSNKGSLLGSLVLTAGANVPANTITGSLTWLKPANTARAYAAGFGPAALSAFGGYLAPAPSKHVVLGLPDSTASAALLFDEGGISDSAINPDLDAFTFTVANKVILPQENPGRTTLTINAATGAVSGKFTLVDDKLTRTVTYKGIIVRSLAGGVEAEGYFLLPQIPATGETSATSPILSGQVYIQQQ